MSDYEKADRECEAVQKRHGPGGELPTLAAVSGKPIKKKNTPADASWEPVKPERSDIEKVKAAALSIIPYAAMSGIVFWWQQTGQLAEATGFYSLIILALLGGINIGRCSNG